MQNVSEQPEYSQAPTARSITIKSPSKAEGPYKQNIQREDKKLRLLTDYSEIISNIWNTNLASLKQIIY